MPGGLLFGDRSMVSAKVAVADTPDFPQGHSVDFPELVSRVSV